MHASIVILAYLALYYFSTFALKQQNVVIFYTTTVWNISHYKKKWARWDNNVYWSLRKYQ